MADEGPKRYPQNAPGPFFVEDGCCISCGAPEYVAPDLMAHDSNDKVFYHCFFKKQPSTPEETEQAIQAVWVSCCGAVQYDGDDPIIRQRFAELKVELKQRLGPEQSKKLGL